MAGAFSPLAGPVETLADLVRAAESAWGEREAFRSLGRSLSYRDLLRDARAVTSWLQQAGLAKGERVAIMMPNLLPYPVCLYGALLGGYAVVNVNPLYTPRELALQLADSGAKALFVLEPFAHVAQAALAQAPGVRVVVARTGDLLGAKGHIVDFVVRHVTRGVPAWRIDGHARFADALAAGRARDPAPVAVLPGDVAFLQYTGGTTGVAKGVVLLHRNVVAHTAIVTDFLAGGLGTAAESYRTITALPMYHAAALMTMVLTMPRFGGSCVLIANPRDLDGLIGVLAHERFTLMGGVNTLYRALLDHPAIGRADFSQCRLFAAGAMATQKTVSDRWQALTGRPLVEGYGLSEATAVVAFNPIDLAAFSGTVGTAAPRTEISIRDDAGNALPAGEPGEVCVRGPQVMAGYWNRPDATAEVMTADGFLRTGDIGSLDAQGQLRLHDRKKDMVIVSGFNVYPNEVEAVLVAHPGIAEAAVVGIPDPRSGEAVAASIVRRDPGLDEAAIVAHCRESLAAYKCPHHMEFVTDLPKTPVGKVLRRAVRDRWRAGGATPH